MPATEGKDRSRSTSGGIQSLERAAALLDIVEASGEHGASLTDMAEATGLHSSTVFHLTKTLEKLGYLARLGEGKQFYIGPRLFSLAAGAPQFRTLSLLGQPVLDALSAETGESSHLAVLSGDRILIVAQAQAKGMLQIAGTMGQARPIHATAIGKVLLADCRPAETERILKSVDFESFTSRTITDPISLQAEIEKVRYQGYAEDLREFDDNIRCLAIIVPGFSKRIKLSIGLSGPHWRLDDNAAEAHLTLLRKHARVLSDRFGSGSDPN